MSAPFVLSFLLLAGALAPVSAPALHTQDAPKDAPSAPVERVRVPAFANTTCPIMGKPASTRLYVDTELGRIYVCCKTCNADVLADPAHAHKTAYPAVKKLANTRCPIDGAAVDEKSPTVVLQGFELRVHTAACAAEARADAQRWLALVNDPKLVDVGNATCPITGDAVARNVVAVVDGALVRFASPKAIEEARKDPAKTLAKARELRAAEIQRAELERAKKDAPQDGTPAPKRGG